MIKIPPITKSTILLALFATCGSSLLLWADQNTKERIAVNEAETLKARLNEIVPESKHDNALLDETVSLTSDALGSKEPLTAYIARKNNKPVAAVFTVIAPDGYSGKIKLLVGINYDSTIAGVRAISHKETPGLGDKIDVSRSDWIQGFDNRSLQNPTANDWKVKKDGGEFDAFTGATITPRAVVKAVYKTLSYFEQNKNDLFKQQTNAGQQYE